MMFFRIEWTALLFAIHMTCLIEVYGLSTTTNKTCDKTTHGQFRLYQNKNGDDEVLICAKKNGSYRWKFLNGAPSLGEEFDPAQHCSDIVDNYPNPKDDYYWITNGNGDVVKVWCDVHTDGGGFMLVGVQDNPSLWNVPFNSSTVRPDGPSQWSSRFGNLVIEEFAVQVSMTNNSEATKAHWLYRLNSKRQLEKLLGVGSGGCTVFHSGIGNVKYVKDILGNTIMKNKFNCSKFGAHVNSDLGWARMNKCFKQGCSTGYAYFPGLAIKFDSSGSFSFSAASEYSGVTHSSTAFVGCDLGKCCACFGPKGGQQNYCGLQCTSINGGTVLQNAYVWFWVRTTAPKRVWKRCMQFEVKTEQGNLETHFIDRTTGSTQKGTCSDNFHTFLNEGTISVLKQEYLQNIPHVAGLFSFCNEKKSVSVSDGKQWNNLAHEKQVEVLQGRIKYLEEFTSRLEVLQSCSAIKKRYPELPSGSYKINPAGYAPFEVQCDMSSRNGVGVTVIGHNSENRTKVAGYPEIPGSYGRKIVYKNNLADIAALTKVSQHCEQFIKWECINVMFIADGYSWWVSTQGNNMTYWGGATGHPRKCACAMTNSCANGKNCNCDNNDGVLRKDEGYLTDKNTLPVTELRFGDFNSVIEHGNHTLGKLLCWG